VYLALLVVTAFFHCLIKWKEGVATVIETVKRIHWTFILKGIPKILEGVLNNLGVQAFCSTVVKLINFEVSLVSQNYGF